MSYMVAQLRKQDNLDTYMEEKGNNELVSTMVSSRNIFNESGNTNFTDFAWEGNFETGKVYYLRFSIQDIQENFYNQIASNYTNDVNKINFNVTLRSGNSIEAQDAEQTIGSGVTRVTPVGITENRFSTFSYVFTPTANFSFIVLKIVRQAFDVFNINTPSTEEIPMPRERWIQNKISNVHLYELKNIIPEGQSSWLKFGYQGRPGSLIVVNKEPIRVGRSGIYEINNGTQITSFMLAAPDRNIEAFLLDYAYETD